MSDNEFPSISGEVPFSSEEKIRRLLVKHIYSTLSCDNSFSAHERWQQAVDYVDEKLWPDIGPIIIHYYQICRVFWKI